MHCFLDPTLSLETLFSPQPVVTPAISSFTTTRGLRVLRNRVKTVVSLPHLTLLLMNIFKGPPPRQPIFTVRIICKKFCTKPNPPAFCEPIWINNKQKIFHCAARRIQAENKNALWRLVRVDRTAQHKVLRCAHVHYFQLFYDHCYTRHPSPPCICVPYPGGTTTRLITTVSRRVSTMPVPYSSIECSFPTQAFPSSPS